MKKIKVAVLSGGPSSEHEVSLKSAENVIKNLRDKFEILHILVTKDGAWVEQTTQAVLTESEGIEHLQKCKVDLVFIVIHGEYGEDGTIQKLLESNNIPFTGSKSRVSSLALDKVTSSHQLTASGLNVPEFRAFTKNDKLPDKFVMPVVVKPTDRGSSVGITIVDNEQNLLKAVKTALMYSDNFMIQNFVAGRELTCAVIEALDGEIMPLVPTEIIPNSDHTFFDYAAKYFAGASVEITPPNLPKEMIRKIQNAAVIAHKALGCSHISRSDFILKNNELYILEVNTIPGMTDTSLLPQGAKAAGIEFPILLDIIIEAALR